jgi:hypothetical protein
MLKFNNGAKLPKSDLLQYDASCFSIETGKNIEVDLLDHEEQQFYQKTELMSLDSQNLKDQLIINLGN